MLTWVCECVGVYMCVRMHVQARACTEVWGHHGYWSSTSSSALSFFCHFVSFCCCLLYNQHSWPLSLWAFFSGDTLDPTSPSLQESHNYRCWLPHLALWRSWGPNSGIRLAQQAPFSAVPSHRPSPICAAQGLLSPSLLHERVMTDLILCRLATASETLRRNVV